MTQTYTDALAVARMRNRRCPECGRTVNDHSGSGGPGGCLLTDNGVAQRVHEQRQRDSSLTERPAGSLPGNCGALVAVHGRGVATCTQHGLGHYDPVLDLSWPDGEGTLVGSYADCKARAPGLTLRCTLAAHGVDLDHRNDDAGVSWPAQEAALGDLVELTHDVRWASETIPAGTQFRVAHVEPYVEALGGDVLILNHPGTEHPSMYGPHVQRPAVRRVQ